MYNPLERKNLKPSNPYLVIRRRMKCGLIRSCLAALAFRSCRFHESDIQAYFESVILANHTEPLRAMVAFLFRERHPGKPGRPFALQEPA
jgi:hypothetical protein